MDRTFQQWQVIGPLNVSIHIKIVARSDQNTVPVYNIVLFHASRVAMLFWPKSAEIIAFISAIGVSSKKNTVIGVHVSSMFVKCHRGIEINLD